MKIRKTADEFGLSYQDNNLCVDACAAGEFFMENGTLTYIHYSQRPVPYRYFEFQQQCYIECLTETVIPSSFIPYKNKQITLKDTTGKPLALSPEKIYCIINNLNLDNNSVYAAYMWDFPEEGEESLVLFDAISDKLLTLQVDIYGITYKKGYFYGFDGQTKELVKFDNKLTKKWSYKVEVKVFDILICNNTLVSFVGPTAENRELINGRGQHSFSGGELVGLNDIDGAVVWKREIPNAVDEMKLMNEILYVVSADKILLLSPDSGELITLIDTQTAMPFRRERALSIYIDHSFIYYAHYEQGVILIYDVISYELIKRVELPDGYHPRYHDFFDEKNDKQYFSLHNLTQYGARYPTLEIDLNNLDTAIEIEQEPNMHVELVTSKESSDEQELVITMNTTSLDDALRFGEIHTRDYAQWHSYHRMGMTFADRKPCENFNGIIRFIYSGSDESVEIVNQHLTVMEQRFAEWNSTEGFYANTDKNQLTKLIATYVQ